MIHSLNFTPMPLQKDKTIYLVRHGETNFNTDPVQRMRGRNPVPLNDIGLRHADQAGQFLKDQKIDIIYYSEVVRAKQTAEAVYKYHQDSKFVAEPLVIDIDWGSWESKTFEECFGSADGGDFFAHPENLIVPNGEQLYDCMSRMKQMLFKILNSPEENICIVSHGANLNLLALLIFESPMRNFWTFYMSACGVSKISMHDINKFTLKYWNHSQHLK